VPALRLDDGARALGEPLVDAVPAVPAAAARTRRLSVGEPLRRAADIHPPLGGAAASLAGMGHHRSEPPRSSGRALIASGIGLIVFAAVGAVSLTTGSDAPMSLRSALSPLVAILGVPVGVACIVGGIAKIRRGHR